MQRVPFDFNAERNLNVLSNAAFLTTHFEGKTNVMVISWGALGFMWRLPIFVAMVRRSRFTHSLLDKSREFTVTFPYADQTKAVAICGQESGRRIDKLAASGLSVRAGQSVATPVLDIPGMQLECKIVYERLMGPTRLDKTINELWYDRQSGNYHTFFIGEVVDSYLTL